MAKENDPPKKSKGDTDKKSGGKVTVFLIGGIIGLIIGVVTGWMIRPPESFKAEELRAATEKKFLEAKDGSREKLADFAEDLAQRLRKEAKR